METVCMKCQILFSEENIDLASVELAYRPVKVKRNGYTAKNIVPPFWKKNRL